MDNQTQTPSADHLADRIVVGVDGSDSSILALRRGAVIAAATHVPLEAVTTWHFTPTYYVPDGWSPEGDAKQALDEAIQTAFGDTRPADFTARVVEGLPAEVLISLSTSAGMLVVGSRGHGGFAGLLLGSVSSRCAEYAKCPVLVVHGANGDAPAA